MHFTAHTTESHGPAADFALTRERAAAALVVEALPRFADLRQWDALVALFAAEVELDYGVREVGAPAVLLARWRPRLERFSATQHALADLAVDLSADGAQAQARGRFFATHLLDGALLTYVGTCAQTLRRTAQGWQITALRLVVDEQDMHPAPAPAAEFFQ
jgi:hypothetical protein